MAPRINYQNRKHIIELRETGCTIKEIVRRTGITRKSIYFWLRRYKETGGDLSARQKKIHRRSTTEIQDAAIVAAHKNQPQLTTLLSATNYNVSTATIRRRLKAAGFKLWNRNQKRKKTDCTKSKESQGNKNSPQPDAAPTSPARRSQMPSHESDGEIQANTHDRPVTDTAPASPVCRIQTPSHESDGEMETDIHPISVTDRALASPMGRTPTPSVDYDEEMEANINPNSLAASDEGGRASHSGDDSDDEKETGDDKKSVHKCNTCQLLIKTFRYTCVQCPDFTMCSECELKGVHPDHYVLRIPGLRPYAEVKAVLDQIRSMSFPDIDEEKVYIDSIKMEMKEEPDENDPLRIPPPECDDSLFDDEKIVEHDERPSNTTAEVRQMKVNLQEKIANLNESTLLDTKEVNSTNITVNIKQLQQGTQMTDCAVLRASGVASGTGVNTVLANIPPEKMIPRKNVVYIGQLQQPKQVMTVRDSAVLRANGTSANAVLANIAPEQIMPRKNLVYTGQLQQASQMTSIRDSMVLRATGVTSGTGANTVLANIATENVVYVGQPQQASQMTSLRENAVFRASGIALGTGPNTVLTNIASEEKIVRNNLVYIGQLQQPNQVISVRESVVHGDSGTGANTVLANIAPKVTQKQNIVYIGQSQQANQMTSVRDTALFNASGVASGTGANTLLANIAPKGMIPRQNLVYIRQPQQASQMTSVRDSAVLRTSGVAGRIGANTVLANIAPEVTPRQNILYIGQLQQASQMASVRNNAVLRACGATSKTGANPVFANIAPKK